MVKRSTFKKARDLELEKQEKIMKEKHDEIDSLTDK